MLERALAFKPGRHSVTFFFSFLSAIMYARYRSRRNVRGAGWHKRGYRANGHMWINVRRGSYGSVHGMDVHEDATVADVVAGCW